MHSSVCSGGNKVVLVNIETNKEQENALRSSTYLFNLKKGSSGYWKPLKPLLRARKGITSAILNGDCYTIGGDGDLRQQQIVLLKKLL